eukprot:11803471-Karenia_brevis.AAC.1
MPGSNSEIDHQNEGWFGALGADTLQANLGWDRWSTLYGSSEPLVQYGPGQSPSVPRSDWCCRICVKEDNVTVD